MKIYDKLISDVYKMLFTNRVFSEIKTKIIIINFSVNFKN